MTDTRLTMTIEDDTTLLVTRFFAAPPERVYRAHTEPALLQKWCLGPEGWTMPVCICEAHEGGRMRYEWSDGKGNDFYLTGEFVELVPNARIVHIERMHLPDPTPDCRVVTEFEARDGGTWMTMRLNVSNKEARDAMLASGMEYGMEASYVRLDGLG